MAPASLCALPTTSLHALDKLGELLPGLDQGIGELPDSLWWYLAASDAPLLNVPYVLNWI